MKPFLLTIAFFNVILNNNDAGASDLSNAPAPPWAVEKLKVESIPAVYLTEWKKAENRNTCAPLVLHNAEKEPKIKIRRANFHGGWAVAYDTPNKRSSFGIAGAGVEANHQETIAFSHTIKWTDGSVVGYDLEGGVGPDTLAFLSVAGQTCLYNIWSSRGKAHLEHLISTLRLVDLPKP